MPRLKQTKPPIVQPAVRARALTLQAAHRASQARRELAIVVPLFAGVLLAYVYREEVFGLDLPVRVIAALVLIILGWRLARDVGRSLAPPLFARMDPAAAGTVASSSGSCSSCSWSWWRRGSPASTRARWPSRARSRRSCSAWRRSRRSATSSPASS
jgi:hypothetical protein